MLYCTSSIPSRGSAATWPASSCSRVRVDKRGVRSRPVASLWTQVLCDCSTSSLDPVPPWSRECAATDSHTSRIVRSTSPRCLPSGLHSVDDRSRSVPSPRSSRSPLDKALPRTHSASKMFTTLLFFVLHLSFLPSPQCLLDVLWSSRGDQRQILPSQCVE